MDKNPNILQASNTVIGVLTELQQYPGETESTVDQLLKLINTALNLGKISLVPIHILVFFLKLGLMSMEKSIWLRCLMMQETWRMKNRGM